MSSKPNLGKSGSPAMIFSIVICNVYSLRLFCLIVCIFLAIFADSVRMYGAIIINTSITINPVQALCIVLCRWKYLMIALTLTGSPVMIAHWILKLHRRDHLLCPKGHLGQWLNFTISQSSETMLYYNTLGPVVICSLTFRNPTAYI